MAWVILSYHPVSFFSLRPASATASGGQTLLTPTAFALKIALLNAAIQTAGLNEGKRRFPLIRDLRIALALPEQITVLKSFAKIRRPFEVKDKSKADEKIADLREKAQYPFQSTIAYREFVQFGNPLAPLEASLLRIACVSPTGEVPTWLGETLLAINYLGKRGGFFQPISPAAIAETLDTSFVEITHDSADFDIHGTLQMLDDCDPSMTFDHADIYNDKHVRLGKERVLHHVVLPYQLTRSSHSYSLYQRVRSS